MTRKRYVRPRYDRIAALVLAVGVTGFAVLAGLGVIGPTLSPAPAYASAAEPLTIDAVLHPPTATNAVARVRAGVAARNAAGGASPERAAPGRREPALPEESGTGRRVVFDMSQQRVWLVGANDSIDRSYLVSGSLTHNLRPGEYQVYSRSRWAVGVSDSGVMQYFVRFTRGDNAAIGFHSIPTKNGRALQTRAQLGTPQSHGCIRQAMPDAIALWDFAPVGTRVAVVA